MPGAKTPDEWPRIATHLSEKQRISLKRRQRYEGVADRPRLVDCDEVLDAVTEAFKA